MNAQGQVIDRYVFDAWGNELTSPQSQVSNPFRYVGRYGYYLDTESALMLLGVRYYRAANGLFLSRDLTEEYGYTYAFNNPLGHVDPDGMRPRKFKCPSRDPQRPPLGRCDPKQPPWGPNCPQPDPNVPDKKPNQCDIYLNCCNQGYVYCCNAYEACQKTPNDRGANCVRGCLQSVATKLPKGKTIADQSCECLYWQHLCCFESCGWWPPVYWPFHWLAFREMCTRVTRIDIPNPMSDPGLPAPPILVFDPPKPPRGVECKPTRIDDPKWGRT